MQTQTAANLDNILAQGGAPRIALLRLSVMSVTPAPVFVFLAQEYRLRPNHAAALALYDAFCAPQALARIDSSDVLPPQDLQLGYAVEILRRQWAQIQSPEPAGRITAITVPRRELFDVAVKACRDDATGGYRRIASSYNPELTPVQNLPGGKMTAGQRQFVEFVWKPEVRPALIAAGFWRIADIE